jgi:2-polyprenyl-3-methyl-5-hydroxy-6-metoxy-1,4-benzoquinol methylase
MRVLEVGCGTGLFTEKFARHVGEIVAVDLSSELLCLARSRSTSGGQVEWVNKSLADYQTSQRFDAIIGSSVLHHLDLDEAVAAIYRLLKPGGSIGFAEPNFLNPQVFAERKVGLVRRFVKYVSPDETAFVRWTLRSRLMEAGFAGVRIKPFDWLHPSTPRRCIPTIRRVGDLLEQLPLVREFAGSLLIHATLPSSGGTTQG